MTVVDRSKISRREIPARVASLAWQGDALVDWVGGGKVFYPDGTVEDPRVGWAYPFDASCATADGRFAIIYQRRGTKALLLRDGKLQRELNRSFYHADVYDYPICIWPAPDSRVLIAHCPEDYRRIDIEDAETGTRLTNGDRKPEDFFHSRLMVNPSGTRFLSAGWVWQPWEAVVYYDIAEAVHDPSHLDNVDNHAPGALNVGLAEEGSACWQTDKRVLIGGTTEENSPPDPEDLASIGEPRLHARGIAIYDVVEKKYIRSVVIDDVPGEMMPVGESHAICFCGNPRLVSLESGQVLSRWDDLDTGPVHGPTVEERKFPPLAIDIANRRFAVYDSDKITVIQIDPSE